MPSHYYQNAPSNSFTSNPMYQENRPRYDMDPLLAKLAEASVQPPAKTGNPLLRAIAKSVFESAGGFGGGASAAPAVPNLPEGYTDGTYGEFTTPGGATVASIEGPEVPFQYKTKEDAEAAVKEGGGQVVAVKNANEDIIGYNVAQPGRKVEDMINSAKQIIENAE
tara:strand:- start:37 stop:534 length:498 start_codon:yes stop_codon:yes gene_type:complete